MAVLFGGFPMAQAATAEPVPAPLAGLENGSETLGIGDALSTQDLEGLNGRKGVNIEIKDVNAIFSNTDQQGFLGLNSIEATNSSFTTGGNSIGGSAFSNMNGIATVIQNSGNQVLIQNATVVDVIVK
ncbi:MAG TPA: hypothetical protein VN450_08245 [Candidatus Methylomirabilis sp.]|nr:hypothetical protein [Candidatus Methylomirabilis sp.]